MKKFNFSDIFVNPGIFFNSKYDYEPGGLMHIEVIGHRSKHFKDIIARAVEYYCTLLMSKRMCQSIEVYIILKKKLENNFSGYCSYIDHHSGVRTFEIEVAKGQSVRDTLSTIAHEVVHLKQFAKGELKDSINAGNISVWNGQKINEDKIDYWDLPFEIEAYGRERGMMTRFVQKEGLTEKKFLGTKVR